MKKLFFALILSSVTLFSSVASTPRPSKQTMSTVDKALEFSIKQTQNLYSKVEGDKSLFPCAVKDGKLVTNKVNRWTSGFFAGTMWYLYEHSNDATIRSIAEEMTERVLPRQYTNNTHDIGFLIYCSAGNGYRLTSNQEYYNAIITAGNTLATRFTESVGCIRSWDNPKWNHVVIIDNMMNLELLCASSSLSGDNTHYNMAKSHADVTLKNHFREDYSTYHWVDYDTTNGEKIGAGTYQGLADDSSWARGQGWALYGYTMMYRQTGKKEYLDQAVHVADFIINHPNLPKDKIPYWDFDAPALRRTERDASAGALMASAFIELSTYVDETKGAELLKIAEQQIKSLSSSSYRSQKVGDNQGFILAHSVGSKPGNSEVDTPLSYADYYYVEALIRLKKLYAGAPVVELCTAFSENQTRAEWLSNMDRISRPVLRAMSQGRLHELMPIEMGTTTRPREHVTHLEAIGRLIAGISAWTNLPLGDLSTPEQRLRNEYLDLIAKSIANGVDKSSPDYLNFTEDKQPLVDAAFLSHGLMRSRAIWDRLDPITQQRLIDALKSTRIITPLNNNWLLFSAMVELALKEYDGEWEMAAVETAIQKHKEWYKGDSWYGDGENFHLDYYNSFVIQPMMFALVEYMSKHQIEGGDFLETATIRYKRFATQQEKFISPEGTFPAIGRSLAYRFGAFQALSDVTYRKMLDATIRPAQVREALTKVIHRQITAPKTFDDLGWLRIGFAGHQPSTGESYISTGSLYLCSTAFLVLGLDENDEFWSGKPEMWSSQQIWNGINTPADKAIKDKKKK